MSSPPNNKDEYHREVLLAQVRAVSPGSRVPGPEIILTLRSQGDFVIMELPTVDLAFPWLDLLDALIGLPGYEEALMSWYLHRQHLPPAHV